MLSAVRGFILIQMPNRLSRNTFILFSLLLIALARPVLSEEPVGLGIGQGLSSYLHDLVNDDPSIQEAGLKALAETGDPAAFPLLTALYEGTLYIWINAEGASQIIVLNTIAEPDGQERSYLLNPLTRQTIRMWDDDAGELKMVSVKSAEGRRLLRSALDQLKLFDPSVEARRSAATKLGNMGDPSALPFLERSLAKETNRWARHAMEEAINQLRLADPDPTIREDAAIRLGEIKGLQALPHLKSLLSGESSDPDKGAQKAIKDAIQRIETYQEFQQIVGVAFNGLSLGSILFLMGLGLAITFGLMGVINMAHGEMMMIGAYTAFVLQGLFATYLPPSFHDSYFIAALPISFIVTGAVGLLLEKMVIRFLYGRPLETLLATWGISMILQQAARWYFGDLTSVNAPTWMRGGVEMMVGLVLPYNRIFIIILGAGGLLGVRLLLSRTRWGLRIRAVTQNRDMSACLGIHIHRVDGWTFALGAGLAGVAGCALSLIGNVDPEMGKTYIVESFMVVVVGGVGTLAGTMISSLGIGMLTKIFEPIIGGTGGAVYAKLVILTAIILFLQRRPSGLFQAKGRVQEA